MKLAIVGSRGITNIDVAPYIPSGVTEIVSGGARGVDTLAREYAARGILLVEFLPQYERYGHAAPLKRNAEIAVYADEVLAFWDGRSKGTQSALAEFRIRGKKVTVVTVE